MINKHKMFYSYSKHVNMTLFLYSDENEYHWSFKRINYTTTTTVDMAHANIISPVVDSVDSVDSVYVAPMRPDTG